MESHFVFFLPADRAGSDAVGQEVIHGRFEEAGKKEGHH